MSAIKEKSSNKLINNKRKFIHIKPIIIGNNNINNKKRPASGLEHFGRGGENIMWLYFFDIWQFIVKKLLTISSLNKRLIYFFSFLNSSIAMLAINLYAKLLDKKYIIINC